MDYSYWDSLTRFTLVQAAYLWVEEPPPIDQKLSPKARTAYLMFKQAFLLDKLYIDWKHGELEMNWENGKPYPVRAIVFREALTQWAIDNDCKPPFLFPEERNAESKAARLFEPVSPIPAVTSEKRYENLLKAFGLLIRAYVEKGGKKYGTKDKPNKSQIAEAITQEAENLGLLKSGTTGLRKATLQERISEALGALESGL